MRFIKNIFLFILSILLVFPVGYVVWHYFCSTSACGGGSIADVNMSSVVPLFISYPFCLSFVFTIFGDRWKYFWIAGIYIGVFVLLHFYEMFGFFLKLTLPSLFIGWIAGWISGFLISKAKNIYS